MAFDPAAVARIVEMARAESIDPAALLAVAEVESAGNPFEGDGVTPRFLFERHVFYRCLSKHQPAKLRPAVAQGLAIPKWDRNTQYRDQGTSSGRLKALQAARSIDEECANQACSWGLGQILGENARSLGYASATSMVAQMVEGGVPAQVDSLLRFVRVNGLIDELKRHDWAGFARRYNGPSYAANRYDKKMAEAYQFWISKLARTEPDAPTIEVLRPGSQHADVANLKALIAAQIAGEEGYGPILEAAVRAFQKKRGLVVDSVVGPVTRTALGWTLD